MFKKTLLLAVFSLLVIPMTFAANVPLASVGPTITTFTDSTLGSTFDNLSLVYWVTTVDANCPTQPFCGESNPSNFVQVDMPTSGSHTVTLTWVPDSGTVKQNIYRSQLPVPPSNLTGLVN